MVISHTAFHDQSLEDVVRAGLPAPSVVIDLSQVDGASAGATTDADGTVSGGMLDAFNGESPMAA